MATLNLGRIKPVFRGAYNNGTAYVVDDIVTSGGSSYICIQASTGNAVSNATYWTLMAEGGDVASTLTTQGDILYRDGSGLQRLAAGTSGQVLQTGGAGANPSWTAVSSDYVKITSGTFSNISNVDFASSLFDGSTYKSFVNMIEIQDHDTYRSGNGEFRPQISGSNVTSHVSSCGIGMNSSSTTVTGLTRDNADSCVIFNDGVRNARALIQIESNGMNRSDCNNNHFINNIRPNHDGTMRCRWDFHAVYHERNATSGDGYRVQMVGGATGTYCLYGRK